jgi:hypothetical protein
MGIVKSGKYQHYKGQYYKVIGIAKHSETLEEMVIYQKLYDDFSYWVRPLPMFIESIEMGGNMVKRFTYIDEG